MLSNPSHHTPSHPCHAPRRSHRREYGEPIPGRVLADRLGEFLHAACVRWGSRAYPNALFIACWGERDRGVETRRGDGGDGGARSSDWSPEPSEIVETAETLGEAEAEAGAGVRMRNNCEHGSKRAKKRRLGETEKQNKRTNQHTAENTVKGEKKQNNYDNKKKAKK